MSQHEMRTGVWSRCATDAFDEDVSDARHDSVLLLALDEGGLEFLVDEDEFLEVGEEQTQEVDRDALFQHVCVVHSEHDLQVAHVVALRVEQLCE